MVLQTGLSGTHILVTGGSRGIGKAIVEDLLSQGVNVSYCARNVSGNEFANFQAATDDAQAVGTSVNVGDEAALTKWVEESGSKFGRIDCVVANASPLIFGASSAEWETSFRVDMMHFVTLVNASLPLLTKSKNPSVIVISSFMGREFFRAPPAPYGPFKAAQLQHVQELSHFLGPQGVRVNAISPGPIMFPGGSWEEMLKNTPEWVEQQRLKVPLRRMGKPEEIANAVTWLASGLASYVSGANLLVDGGIHVGTQF